MTDNKILTGSEYDSKLKNMSKIQEVRIEIRPSKVIEGEVGVFSTRELKKDSIVMHASHFSDMHFIPRKAFDEADSITQEKVLGYCIGEKDGFYVPPDLNYISIAWHMNHSCEPNIGFDADDNFVAMRDIQAGEELFWDYGYGETNPEFKLTCNCGSKKCRGIITGNDWKLLKHDPQALPYLSSYVKELIESE